MVVQCGGEVSNEKNLEIPVVVSSRRSSARIKQLKIQAEEKKVSRLRALDDSRSPTPAVKKTKRSGNKRKRDNHVKNAQHSTQETSNGGTEDNAADLKAVVKDEILNQKSSSALVTETLRIFNKYYLHFVQVAKFELPTRFHPHFLSEYICIIYFFVRNNSPMSFNHFFTKLPPLLIKSLSILSHSYHFPRFKGFINLSEREFWALFLYTTLFMIGRR